MNQPKSRGAVAAGHRATAEAAAFALREGGNAFDAIIAAHWCACIAEPVLTSLGGGGFLLARSNNRDTCVYDFFAQTPSCPRPVAEIDFHPVNADFGSALQEFHIGQGAIATPGTVRGLFTVHRELATLPMSVLIAPAVELARQGIQVNELQAYILDVVRPIYLSTRQARVRFCSKTHPDRLVGEGETLQLPELADTLLALAQEGDRLFYEGDIAVAIAGACKTGGGHLTLADLADYQVQRRQPLRIRYGKAELFTNPPPSTGGLLTGFSLKLLEQFADEPVRIDSVEGISRLAAVMQSTNEARVHNVATNNLDAGMLDQALLETYQLQVKDRLRSWRGTTHISVIDSAGNIASLTTSNGEGCGHMLAGTGIMLNNMLGEEDLNPQGFHRWQAGQRLTSMMAPSLLALPGNRSIALGSGGSNRIRSAILQVLLRIVDEQLPLTEAIDRPRIHYENGQLNIEGGFAEQLQQRLEKEFPQAKCWPDRNLFFGGVHAVSKTPNHFECYGDGRRGGTAFEVR